MKFFWFGVVLLAFCVVCEVLSDFSESMLPSKEIRNRVHRTMRVNMRVGKRFGDSEYDDEGPKRRLRLRFRTGKRTFYDVESPDTDYTEPQEPLYNTETYDTNILGAEPSQVDKRDFLSPNRRLRLILRPGKRHSEQFYDQTATSQDQDSDFEDFKRSSPQFLLNPRVGKNDKTWKIRPIENLHKRSDPKATDLWFGPRIGRSNEFEDIPWSYIILNGNKRNLPVFKSNEDERQPNEASTE